MSTSQPTSSQLSKADVLNILALGFGLAITVVDPTLVSLNVTRIERGLDVPGHLIGFVGSIATLTLAATVLSAASMGDLFGRKRLFIWGLLGTIVFNLVAVFVPNTWVLIVVRALDGVALALLLGLSLAILNSSFSSEKRPMAIGLFLAFGGLPSAFLPFLSSFLLDNLGWRGLFIVAPVIAAITLLITFRYVPETPRAEGRRVDTVGVVSCGVALITLVYGISQLQEGLRVGVVVPLAIGLVTGAFFVWWELHQPAPALDLSLFKTRSFDVAVWAGATFNFLQGGFVLVAGLYGVGVRGLSPLELGLALMPATLVQAVACVTAGRVMPRLTTRLTMVLGLLLLFGGALCFATLRSSSSMAVVTVGLALLGVGNAFAQTSQAAIMMSYAPRELTGSVAAVKAGIGQAFYSLGPSVFTVLISTFFLNRWYADLAARGYSRDQAVDALDVARSATEGQLGGTSPLNPEQLRQVVAGAEEVFANAIATTSLIVAIVPLSATLLAFFVLPRQAKRQ